MQPWVIVLLVVIAVLIAALVALTILGRKLQKKQEANNAQLEAAKQAAYAETVKTIMEAISEDLVAALTTSSKDAMTADIAKSLAPYALANRDESVSDVVNKLLRGTTLEDTLKDIHDLNS